MLYNQDWCVLEYLKGKININLKVTEDDVYKISQMSIDEIKKNAVASAVKVVGDNPVICLSGGIDSQTLLYIWNEQQIPFTAVTFDFGNGFNSQELSDAQRFAEYLNIPLKIIKLDVMRFLLRDLKDFSKKYNIFSPQFAVHAYFLDTIRNLGYTGALFGGNGLLLTDTSLDFRVTDAQLLDIEKYSSTTKFPVIHSFLSFDKNLCISLAMLTSIIDYDLNPENPIVKTTFDPSTKALRPNIEVSPISRYESKINSYKKLGCKLIPQDRKKTGFEEIKNYYNSLNNSDLAFDRDFRMPLRIRIPESIVSTVIDSKAGNLILDFSRELNS